MSNPTEAQQPDQASLPEDININDVELVDDVKSQEVVETPESDKPVEVDQKPEKITPPELVEDEEDKVEDPVEEPKDLKQEDPKTNEQPKELPKKRDYSKFKPEDIEVLRKLPNREYGFISQKLEKLYEAEKKSAELEEKVKSAGTFYDHPEAYTLQNEYKQAIDTYSRAEQESNHNYNQAVAVSQGAKAVSIIEGYDQQTGQPIVKTYKVTDQNRAGIVTSLQGMWQQADRVKQDTLGSIRSIKDTYSKDYKSAENDITSIISDFNSKLKDDLKPEDKIMQAFTRQMPSMYQGHPVTKLAAYMYGFIMRQGAKLNEYAEKANKAAKQSLDAKRAGPNITGKKSTTSNNDELLDVEKAEEFLRDMA